MTFLFSSESYSVRNDIASFLERHKRVNPDLSVLDVGASINPWLGERIITCSVDMFPIPDCPWRQVIGDVNDPNTFNIFRDNEFDFVSCTHVLEDIRDPLSLIQSISRIGKGGFISMPNRHQEMSDMSSRLRRFGSSYLGYSHHRWIFHIPVNQNILIAVCKWPAVSMAPNKLERIIYKLVSRTPLLFPKSLYDLLHIRDLRLFSWVDSSYVSPDYELGIIYRDQISFSYLNNDYAGDTPADQVRIFNQHLSTPASSFETSVGDALALLFKNSQD